MSYYESNKAYPAEPMEKIVVRQSSYMEPHPAAIPMDVNAFVAHILQSCLYETKAVPHIAVVSAWTSYYICEVENGDHDQFIGNSCWEPVIRNYAHEGLRILCLPEYDAILSELELFSVTDPQRFEICDWSDPTIEQLDDRFHALSLEDYYRKHRDWLMSSSILQVYPDDEYHALMEGLAERRQSKANAT